MHKNFDINRITRIAIVAAVYVVLTVAVAPLSYDDLQFRFSEVLVLLCFYNKDYCISLTLGCAIANLFSPFALIDVPVGSVATLIAVILMAKSPNIYIASIFPTVTNALLVGASLTYVYGIPYYWSALSVAIGEFAVVSVVGVILFRSLLQRNTHFMKLIGNTRVLRSDKTI